MPLQPQTYVGWLRDLPKGRWRAVTQANDVWCCWERLLQIQARHDCERLVLPEGVHPSQTRRSRK